MYYLNRLRGTHSWWAKIIAIFLGLVFGFATWNPYIGVAVAVGYLAGESMGWGQWIGGIITREIKIEGEGKNNGIQWITSKFYNEGEYEYNVLALGIRGFYWWFLTFAPLMFIVNPIIVLSLAILLGVAFPLSVIIATEKLGDYSAWELAEHYYGGAQDVGIIILLAWIVFL
tara:strand:- start:13305 stop:13820 length:516 start_codon:yes stop_codon:yes gene_type:complete